MLAASIQQKAYNVTVWRPSVCLSRRHTHGDSPGAACDAASVHFSLTIRRTDILIYLVSPGPWATEAHFTFQPPFCRTIRITFFHSCVSCWNNLPLAVTSATSLKQFINALARVDLTNDLQ